MEGARVVKGRAGPGLTQPRSVFLLQSPSGPAQQVLTDLAEETLLLNCFPADAEVGVNSKK